MSTCISQHGEYSIHTPDDARFYCTLCGVLDEDGLLAEVERLTRWKAEALPVMDGLQDLGQALGLPLGERITGPIALLEAVSLRIERDELAATVARVEALADRWTGMAETSVVRACGTKLRAALAGGGQ